MRSSGDEVVYRSKPGKLHLYILFFIFIILPNFFTTFHSYRYFAGAFTLVSALSITTLKSFVFTTESVTRKYLIPSKIGLMVTEWDYEEFEKAIITYKNTRKGPRARVILLFGDGEYELENKLPPEFKMYDESFFPVFEDFLRSKNIDVEIRDKRVGE